MNSQSAYDRWLLAMIAGPCRGTCSSPSTRGRNGRLIAGPSSTCFSSQYAPLPSPSAASSSSSPATGSGSTCSVDTRPRPLLTDSRPHHAVRRDRRVTFVHTIASSAWSTQDRPRVVHRRSVGERRSSAKLLSSLDRQPSGESRTTREERKGPGGFPWPKPVRRDSRGSQRHPE